MAEDTIDLEEDIFDGEDELLQVSHAKEESFTFMNHIFTTVENVLNWVLKIIQN